MNSHPLITLLVPTLVAVVSWFAGSWLSARRDRANKRRDLRIQYLIGAYRRLADATERKDLSATFWADLGSAFLDVQLFGSADQIVAAHEFADDLVKHGHGQLVGLLSSLREDLREELKLEPVEGQIRVLRPVFAANEKQ